MSIQILVTTRPLPDTITSKFSHVFTLPMIEEESMKFTTNLQTSTDARHKTDILFTDEKPKSCNANYVFYISDEFSENVEKNTRIIALQKYIRGEKRRTQYAFKYIPRLLRQEEVETIKMFSQEQGVTQDYDRKRKRREERPCWFCLSNEQVEKHIIVDIAEEYYLTVAKGPLEPCEHIIIIPIEHTQQVDTHSAELTKYVKAFKDWKHTYVGWCIGFTHHTVFQLVAVNEEQLQVIRTEVENMPGMIAKDEEHFQIRFDLNGDIYTTINRQYSAFLPREIVAKAMGLNDRIDWTHCVSGIEEETKETAAVRDEYLPLLNQDEQQSSATEKGQGLSDVTT